MENSQFDIWVQVLENLVTTLLCNLVSTCNLLLCQMFIKNIEKVYVKKRSRGLIDRLASQY